MKSILKSVNYLSIQARGSNATIGQYFLIKIFICVFYTTSLYADSNDTCANLLNIVDSPSYIDSPCASPFKKVFIELNYIAQQLGDHASIQQNFPNTVIRIGLPANNEFFVGTPNYIDQKSSPKSGSTASYFGLKQSINYTKKWLFALEQTFNAPGGSYAYGSQGWGATFSGIANYTINDQFSLTGMLAINRLSDSKRAGGHYFNSITPDLMLSYSPSQTLSFYGEVYGQSKISASEGAGFNFDAGVLFLVYPNTIFDLSAGQQLYNYFGNFKNYINLGVSVLL